MPAMRKARPGLGHRSMRARLAWAVMGGIALLAAGLLVFAWTHGDSLLGRLEARAQAKRTHLGTELLGRRHGLAFYASLDESVPLDLVSGRPLRTTAAARVPGAIGYARRLSGHADEAVVSPVRWSRSARDGQTLALRARFPQDAPTVEQRLVWDHESGATIGLRLRGDTLEAVFTDASGFHCLATPAPALGRFAHIALSLGANRAALFIDGAERASCPVSLPLSLPTHFVAIGSDRHFPPSFDVDEWSLWQRPLSGDEIARFASSRRPLPALLEPRAAARALRSAALVSAFREFLATVGALGTLSQTSPTVLNRTIPTLELRLSRSDRRHFRAAHIETVGSGARTRHAAHAHLIQATFGGRSERIAAWLDESAFSPPLSNRPAFVLAAEGDIFGDGSGLVRLYPPEQHGARRPSAARPLPLDANSLVRLHINGDFLGLYCLVPFEEPAPPWFVTGPREISRPDRLHFSSASSTPADGAGLSEKERESAWRRMLALLESDPGFPLRPPEARLLARRHAESRQSLLLADPAPGPEPLLGDNPAALYVTNNLDLAAAGPGITWQSSDPDTISPSGHVSRPNGPAPRVVELTATLPGGETRTYRFRVMPRTPGLPALFLSFGRPLDKLVRTDFACLRIPAGENPVPEWLFGTGPTGGGAKLRGNTSFLTGRRRSINLRFDEPVPLPGVAKPAQHLLLLSGYADASRLRNALSFDAFRAMAGGEAVRASLVSWTEVFVNGAYAGVWECCPRLQDVLDETFADLYKVRSSHGLWTDPEAAAESVDRVDENVVDDPYAPIRDIVRLVAESVPSDLAASAPAAFDLSELLDFYLLLNFTGNEDGRVTNQFIGRRETDGRWLLLPWDYDKTFRPGRIAKRMADGRSAVLRNPLFDRLFAGNPALRKRLAAHWRELRAGPLSDTALDRWIDERAAVLAPFMDEDYRVVPPLGHDGDFRAAVEEVRAEAHASAAWLDARLAR